MWRMRHRLVIVQSGQDAALWTRPNRSGIETCVRAGLAGVTLTWIGWCQPAAATVCRVPAAVLCEGCVGRLSIRIAPGGTCRIGFTSATSIGQTGTVKFVDIDVETEPHRPAPHRVSAPHPSVVRDAVPLRASSSCFVFNGRRFCE
jgi:hypothetical protein